MSTSPDDLITAKEAANIAERTKTSVRGWVRKSLLTGYKKDPAKSNSALMISKSELLIFLAENNKHIKKGGRPANTDESNEPSSFNPSSISVEKDNRLEQMIIQKLELELKLKTAETEIGFLKELLGQKDAIFQQMQKMEAELIESRKRVERDLEFQRLETQQAKDKIQHLEARLEQIMLYLSILDGEKSTMLEKRGLSN